MQSKNTINYYKLLILLLLGIITWFMEVPEGLTPQAWHLFVIFLITILGTIINTMPLEILTLVSVTMAAITKTIPMKDVLAGFGVDVVWLVVMAFFISRSVIKTGLGSRIAYFFIYKLGGTSLGLSYGLLAAEFILSPFIPSVAARSGGIIFPIVQSLIAKYTQSNNENIESKDNNKQQNQQHKNHQKEKENTESMDIRKSKFGAFMIQTCLQGSVITSAMFLTAMAANPIVVSIAASQGIIITWSDWAMIAIIPGLCNLIILPIMLYIFLNPGILRNSSAPIIAKKALIEMGPLKRSEGIVVVVFIMLIALWTMEKKIGLNTTTTVMLGFVILLLTNVLTLDDILEEKGAWKILIWFSIFVMLAESLSKHGVTPWFSNILKNELLHLGYSNFAIIIILLVFFFYSHYFFASITTHITVMYATFLGIFISFNISPMIAALSLAFTSILSGGLTHYTISSAPIFFSAGYLNISKWMGVSFIITLINFIIWITIGAIWWHFIGMI